MVAAFVRAHTTGTATSSGSTVSATLAAGVSAGNLLVAQVVNDNSSSTQPTAVFSKPANETASWVLLKALFSPDSAANGAVINTLAVIRTTVSWASGTTITATMVDNWTNQSAISVPKKVFLLAEFSGVTTTVRNGIVSAGVSNAGGGIASASIGTTNAGDLVLCAVGSEDSAAPTITTSGFTSVASVATSGQVAAGVAARLAYQIPSADITNDPAVGVSFAADGGVMIAGMSAVGAVAVNGDLAATGVLSASAASVVTATGALVGSGALNAAVTPVVSAPLVGAGSISAVTTQVQPDAADMFVTAGISAESMPIMSVTADASVSGELGGDVTGIQLRSAGFDSAGTLDATAARIVSLAADLGSGATLSADAARVYHVSAALAATAAMSTTTSRLWAAFPEFFITADLTVDLDNVDLLSRTLTLAFDNGFAEIMDTPAFVDLLVGNGAANEAVNFELVTGSIVADLEQSITLNEFGSSTASVLLPALNQGIYALRAVGTTSFTSDDLTILVLVDSLSESGDGTSTESAPTPPDISPGGGAWRLIDTTVGFERTWTFVRNPNRWTNPLAPKFLEHAVTTAPDGNVLAWQAAERAWMFEFTGYLDTQAEYEELLYWAQLRRRFWLVDHRDRVHFVTFDHFDARARIVPNKPWAHDYTVRAVHFFSQDVGEMA